MVERRARTRSRPSEGITAIEIEGFKSLYRKVSIGIRPLTILAGANSSGKSSIMQPLLLLKQTLEAPYDPGSLLIDGPNVRFTSANQFLSRTPRGAALDAFTLSIEADSSYRIRTVFKKPPKHPLQAVEMVVSAPGRTSITLRPGMSDQEISSNLPDDLRPFRALTVQGPNGEKLPTRWRVGRNRGFLRFELLVGPGNSPVQLPADFLNVGEHRLLLNHLRRIIHVPGLRGDPQRTQKTTAVATEFPGTFESYVASVILSWQENSDPRLKRVGTTLERLGLTWSVDARKLDDTRVEIRVARLLHRGKSTGTKRDMVSIADVGFGVSQVLPVLVALQVAEPGQLVYVEQPEIHLHPRAQTALAIAFADAAKRGVRVVVETHSSLLLLGIQTLVAERYLPATSVRLHWFVRDETGLTSVSSADLDSAGRFGDWPEDFDTTALAAEKRFMNAVDQVEWGRSVE